MKTLKYFRKKFKMNQMEVAEAIGVSRRAYSSYETGDRKPSVDLISKLADLYGTNMDEICGRTSPQQLFDDARVPIKQNMTLSEDEQRLIVTFRKLTPKQQKSQLNIIDGLCSGNEAIKKSNNNKGRASINPVIVMKKENTENDI